MSEDWRLEQLRTKPLLRGEHWQRKSYRQRSATWDHDHCAGCWVKFMIAGKSAGDEEILHEGFAVGADYVHGAEYEWVCPECFALFKDDMGWTEA